MPVEEDMVGILWDMSVPLLLLRLSVIMLAVWHSLWADVGRESNPTEVMVSWCTMEKRGSTAEGSWRCSTWGRSYGNLGGLSTVVSPLGPYVSTLGPTTVYVCKIHFSHFQFISPF
jgi:hypothetical protein